MAKTDLNINMIKREIADARLMCDMRGVDHINIKLPSPYAPVTVYRHGIVKVTATGARVHSLEET